MIRGLILTALLLVTPLGLAQNDAEVPDPLSGMYVDAEGETTPSHDLFRVFWSGTDGTVTVDLFGAMDPDGALTAILFDGNEGTAEPDQAYILHHGPGGDRVTLASNGTAPPLTVMATNNSVSFQLDAALEGPCVFAVARSVSYHEGGQTVEDVVGWSGPDIENAWNGGVACSQGQPVDAPANIGDSDVGTPVLGMAWFTVGLLAVAAVLRRTQRS